MASPNNWRTCTAGDPKFWPAPLRHLILGNICVYVFLGNFYAAGIATGFGALAKQFRVPYSELTDVIAYPVLALGVGNLFWTPTAICFGKRPVIIISLVVFLVFTIWSIHGKSLSHLVASRVIACFAAGSVESLGPAIIADLYMERYFATAMAIFALSLSAGAQVGPAIAGTIIKARGWQWFFILCAIIIGINLAVTLFLLPETNYRRGIFKGETAAEIDKSAVEQIEFKKQADDNVTDSTADALQAINLPYAGSYFKDLISFRNRGLENGAGAWIKQFSLPFRFIFVPHALFAALSIGVFLGGVVIISALGPQFFAPPPYRFSPTALGLFTLASFIGIIIGFPIAGPVTDLLSRKITKSRNRHEPEHRLPALIVPFLLCPPGLILFAFMLKQRESIYLISIGNALQTSSLVFIPSVTLSVIIDAYAITGSEALVLINAGKNLIAFGITLESAHWLASAGVVKMFWQMAVIEWAVLGLAIPLFFFGPWLRRKTLFLI